MRNIIIILILLALTLWLALRHTSTPFSTSTSTPSSISTSTPQASSTSNTAQPMTVEQFIRANIADISHASGTVEVLGGKFYVTKVEAHGGAGTVWYEDGHNAYIADFTYTVDANGNVTPTSFKVRK